MRSSSQSASRAVAVVKKAFEAWDPSIGMVVIMNAGATLRIVGIVFDQKFEPEGPAVKRAVEFECQGQLYYAAFDRVRENAAVDDPQGAVDVVDERPVNPGPERMASNPDGGSHEPFSGD